MGTVPGQPVGGNAAVIAVQPTITAGAYSDGDAVGGLLTFGNALIRGASTGIIVSASITDKASQDAELDLVLFDASFTATTDNAAFDPSDADLLKCIGYIKFEAGDYIDFNDNSLAFKGNVGMLVALDVEGENLTNIYGQLVTRGTPTYASTSDLVVAIHVLQD